MFINLADKCYEIQTGLCFKLWKLSFIDKPWNNSVDEKDYGCGFQGTEGFENLVMKMFEVGLKFLGVDLLLHNLVFPHKCLAVCFYVSLIFDYGQTSLPRNYINIMEHTGENSVQSVFQPRVERTSKRRFLFLTYWVFNVKRDVYKKNMSDLLTEVRE